MSGICLVIKKEDSEIISLHIESELLPQIVTNPKLYDNDIPFLDSIINTYKNQTIPIFPEEDGILIIDIPNKKILDSQGYTGVNKITPEEIASSKRGSIITETVDDNVVKRFTDLVNSGRLLGFEEWHDKGTFINKSVQHMDITDILESLENIRHVGQFVFSTKPFELLTFCESNSLEQYELFKYLSEHRYLSEYEDSKWFNFIQKLRK